MDENLQDIIISAENLGFVVYPREYDHETIISFKAPVGKIHVEYYRYNMLDGVNSKTEVDIRWAEGGVQSLEQLKQFSVFLAKAGSIMKQLDEICKCKPGGE